LRSLPTRRSSDLASPLALLRDRQTHVARIIEDTPAIRARDDLLIALAGHHHLALQFHVAAAADSMRDADHHTFAFTLAEAFIARQDTGVHRRRQLVAIGLQLCQL